jgi:AmmeMemoRadiSam system protein B/AmmeMemoRadiSam system protein A
MSFVRPAAVAGSFYPADPAALGASINGMLATVPERGTLAPKALILPHAGYVYSGPIAASGYARLAQARDRIRQVVLIGPAHRVAFQGISVSSATAFQTPLGAVRLDSPGRDRLLALPGVICLDQAHAEEHSLEVHLPFLQSLLTDFTLLPLVAGDAPDALVAEILAAVWGGPETLVLVSSDLSHYQDYDSARRSDRVTHDAIMRLDANAFDHHGACGRTPLGGLLLLAKQRGMRIESLDLRNSGDTAGPRDRVVGYGAWALYEPPPATLSGLLLDLARRAIERRFDAAPSPLAVALLPGMQEPGASFVTLHAGGRLRGCVGSAQAYRPLVEDVADNAVKAAFNDPRFAPLSAAELPRVALSLSLLSAPEAMTVRDEADLLAQLRPGIDGLILADQGRHALFLPLVWEQLPEPAAFVLQLKRKAGLPDGHWSPTLQLARFTATDYHEAR